MIQTYQRLQRRRAAGEIDGFTLIELLIVIVVLGILAAIVVFALGGVTGKSAAAACQSDAKTVGVGVAALQAENPTLQSAGLTTTQWQTDMIASATTVLTSPSVTGNPFVQTWPSSSSYKVWVGDGTTTLPTNVTGITPIADNAGVYSITSGTANSVTTSVYGDVYVTGTGTGDASYTYDATLNPIEACNFAVLGHS